MMIAQETCTGHIPPGSRCNIEKNMVKLKIIRDSELHTYLKRLQFRNLCRNWSSPKAHDDFDAAVVVVEPLKPPLLLLAAAVLVVGIPFRY